MRGIVFYITEELAATPANGDCIVNAWWTIHPERGLAFYTERRRSWALEPGEIEMPSPQCNQDEYAARTIQKRIYPDHETKQIPLVFLAHATKEMHRARKLAVISA